MWLIFKNCLAFFRSVASDNYQMVFEDFRKGMLINNFSPDFPDLAAFQIKQPTKNLHSPRINHWKDQQIRNPKSEIRNPQSKSEIRNFSISSSPKFLIFNSELIPTAIACNVGIAIIGLSSA